MKKLSSVALVIFITVCAFLSPASANTVNFTGQLSDWGLSGGADASAIDWNNPSAGILSFVDNGHDAAGGRNYEAYTMLFTYDTDKAYFGIATGFPQGGNGYYYPGDLALKFSGMANPSTYQYGVRLNKTTGGKAGYGDYKGIYSVIQWTNPVPSAINVFDEKLGVADVVYGNNTYGATGADPLYLYEIAVPLNTMDGTEQLDWTHNFTMYWQMACGNDSVSGTTVITPEPASMALFASGLATLFLRKRKQRKT